MSILSYIFKTNWNAKKADFYQWRDLRHNVRDLRARMHDAKIAITHDFGTVNSQNDIYAELDVPACVRAANMPIQSDIFETSDLTSLVYLADKCPQFIDDEDVCGLCQNFSCASIWRNHKYHAAAVDYENARKRMNNFWGEKIRAARQK